MSSSTVSKIVFAVALAVCTACTPAQPTSFPLPTGTPVPATPLPTLAPTLVPTTVPSYDPEMFVGGSGLSFSTADGLWRVNASGGIDLLVDQSSARLSPDSQRVAYLSPDRESGVEDVWLLDLASGTRTDLTNTPDRYETVPMWWPGRPDVLVFGSDTESGMENSDYPTVVNLDGTGYQVLDSDHGGPRALAPNGSAIAYGGYDAPGAIYRWDSGVESFNPVDFGVDADKLLQPAFSPDGSRLAWMVAKSDPQGGSSTLGLAIFDLAARSGQLTHTYQPVGGGGYPYGVAWSPDGRWIAFTTFGEPPSSGRAPNLWVVHPDGGDETYVGEGLNPVWSPDGSQLAFLHTGADGSQQVWLAPSSSWQPAQLSPPDNAKATLFLMGWSAP